MAHANPYVPAQVETLADARNELVRLAETVNRIIDNQKQLQRDDGCLMDCAVVPHTLSDEVVRMMGHFELLGAYAARPYQPGQVVTYRDRMYVCVIPHQGDVVMDMEMWRLIGKAGCGIDTAMLVNALTSTDKSKALAAAQGKVLADLIAGLDDKINGTIATIPDTAVMNAVQEEICNLIEAEGEHVYTDDTQPHNQLAKIIANLNGDKRQVNVGSIDELRALKRKKYSFAYVTGYYTGSSDGGGWFIADTADQTSSDNGGTVIVAADGTRWKRQLQEWVAPQMFGAFGDGVRDDTIAFNKALSLKWRVVIPSGKYKIDGDLIVRDKARNFPGGYMIDGAGVELVGSGKLIIDSCKRINISGIDAPDMTLAIRGMWFSAIDSCRFKTIVYGDAAGFGFSSNYWLRFVSCIYQNIIFDVHAVNANEIVYDGCFSRGNVGQNFKQTADYCIDIRASDKNIQAWKFVGGDISYHNKSIIKIDAAASGEVEILFLGVYFDSLHPPRFDRPKTKIVCENCHCANDLPFSATLPAAARGSQSGWRGDRSCELMSFSLDNLAKNGDLFNVVSPAASAPISNAGGATYTYTADSTSPSGRKLTITQNGSGITFLGAANINVAAPYTVAICLRASNATTKSIQVGFNGLYRIIPLTNEWQLFTMTTGQNIPAGVVRDTTLNDSSGVAWAVDVAYLAITIGAGAPLFLPIKR